MATYKQIESARRYVKYKFNEIHPGLPDAYNPSENYCRYMVNSPSGDPSKSRKAIMKRRFQEYDLFGGTQNPEYRQLQALLEQKGCSNMIPYFSRFCCLNVRDDETCKLMIMGGGSVDFQALMEDIRRIPNQKAPAEVTKILHQLTRESNAAALNGAFTKWFCVSLSHGGTAAEAEITQFYQQLVYGTSRNMPAIDIPDDPSIPFIVPQRLFERLSAHDKDPNLKVEQLATSQKKNITTDMNTQNKMRPGNSSSII